MKKRIFAIALALSMSLGTVSAYAQTPIYTSSVSTSEYATALTKLYNMNYAYPVRSHSDELTILVSQTPVYSEYDLMRSWMPTHLSLVNDEIASLEAFNTLITYKHVEPFYNIQPQLNKIIAAGKLYVDGCNKIYNGNSQGFSIVNSATSSIYDAQYEIAKYCDNINIESMRYLGTAFPSN